MDSSSSAIKIENVWKVFGNTSPEALDAIQNKGISKTEALEEYNSVIGVSDVSFDVNQGEIFCVMGLSGSGKSTLVRHINRLLEPTSGKILINGQDVMQLDREHLQELRNKKIGMVFQEPQSSLNPSLTCGKQLLEAVKNDKKIDRTKKKELVKKVLNEVQLFDDKRIAKSYPHELSGGQKQRVMIAMALLCNPKLLIADEPTTALDVTVQKEIIHLLKSLQVKYKMSILFISHDLSVVRYLCDEVAVMFMGKIVEHAETEVLFSNPQHPYTSTLLNAAPPPDPHAPWLVEDVDE